MKKFTLTMLLILTAIMNATPAMAEILTGSCGENATYTLDTESGLLKIEGSGAMKDFDVWHRENLVPWYSSKSNITKVEIARDITNIGNYAFDGCYGLTSVTIPSSVISIGARAFSGCGLISVTIGDSVTSIGGSAFAGCSLTSVTIGDSVTSIGESAFAGCSGLTSVTFGDSVTSIGERAFCICSNLTSVTIPSSVISIGASAFSDCSSLTSVTIGDSVTSIGESAFYGCSSLTSVTIPNSVTSIGRNIFQNCYGLITVTIGDSVTSIGEYAFSGCSSLVSITLPESIKSIGNYAFDGCYGLTSITLPESIKSIGNYAFSGCSGLTSITLPEFLTSIGEFAFAGCRDLASIIIPSSVTYIGPWAFLGCYIAIDNFTNLSNLTTSDWFWYLGLCDVEQADGLMIKNNTAEFCRKWATSVTIPDNVTSIAADAFHGCTDLTSVIIGNSVTQIGDRAFRSCSGLTSVTIPSSVTSVGDEAFDGCRLMSVVCKVENPGKEFSSSAFSSATFSHTPLYIPAGSFWKYIYDSGWYSFNIIKEYTVSPAEVSESKAYMIADANGFNYTVFEDGELKNVEFSHSLDESDMGTCWQVRKSGSRSYLYSPAAESYATMQDGKLQLTAAPVDVDLCEQDGTLCINGTKCILVLNTEVQTPDAIGTISATSSDDDAIYDLQGRKMQNARNGIFIQNGKKIAIK